MLFRSVHGAARPAEGAGRRRRGARPGGSHRDGRRRRWSSSSLLVHGRREHREMPIADALEAAPVGHDAPEALGDLGKLEGGGDPLREVTATASESVTRLDQVIEDRAHVGLGESVAELAEGTGSMPRRDGDEMRLEEPERLDPRSGGGRGEVLEMIAEGRRELPAHVLQRPRLEGIDGGEPLGQTLVADLVPGPVGEVVGVAGGLGRAMQEGGRGVAKEGFGGEAPDVIEELAHVVRLEGQELLEVDTAMEDKRLAAHRDTCVRYHRTLQGPSSVHGTAGAATG